MVRKAIQVANIGERLAALTPIAMRGPHTSDAEVADAFTTLADFRDGGIFVGGFTGDSGWEIHPKGDEIVQILAGATELTIMHDDGPETFELTAGMLIVVPRGHWHRFDSRSGVSLMTATPQPTTHTFVDDPRGVDLGPLSEGAASSE
ncbi:MAG: cupin domain-containing protein [Chromatiales bacterium]|nr:cupin domain-containing protein [Chromatiales bacterium]